MPRSTSFSPDEVGRAALELVRAQGWDALTARAVGARLGVSVAPVYGAFASMEELSDWLLEEIVRRLDEYCSRPWSTGSFLNSGAGFIAFARDEPKLFMALYRGGKASGVFDRFRRSNRERMPEDERLAAFDPATLDRIYDWLWTFSLGMALAVLVGYDEENSDKAILRKLLAAGSVMMYGIVAGIDEYGGEVAAKAWSALFAEKGISIPPDKRKIVIDPDLNRKS